MAANAPWMTAVIEHCSHVHTVAFECVIDAEIGKTPVCDEAIKFTDVAVTPSMITSDFKLM
jgi:hypothetical protein